MKVVILAAGYAVRLQPLTLTTPKPLLRVGGRAMIDRIIDSLVPLPHSIETVYVITNAKFFDAFTAWQKASAHPFTITIMNDGTTSNETRLGAIRDMQKAITDGRIDADLMVIAGDNLFEFALRDLLACVNAHPGKVVVAFHDIADREAAKKFGVASIGEGGIVVDFEEKPKEPKSTLISTGIYFFPRQKLPLIGEFLRSHDTLDAPGHYIRWLCARREVVGFVFSEEWCDIGDIKSYEEADRKYGHT